MTAQDDKTPIAPPPEFHTDLPVGEILRRTRVHYGQSLDDVSNFLRIRVSQLDALEKGEIDKLPGRVYAIGYIRTYSEYLGLDGEKMIQLFKTQVVGRPAKPELYFPVAASESKAPNLYIIFGSLATLALVIGVWIVLGTRGPDNDTDDIAAIPNVPADMRVAAALEQPSPEPASPAPAAAAGEVPAAPLETPAAESAFPPAPVPMTPPEEEAARLPSINPAAAPATVAAPVEAPPPAQKKEITINVKERSWVEVRDQQGRPILSRILTPGEIFIVPEENYGLRLDTGNAGGLEMLVNGQKLPPLGRQGDILRGLVLDGNQLAKEFPPPGAVAQ
jgi:cytoskeleton protein RodZ